jgi:para-nitrobenzyl esterase
MCMPKVPVFALHRLALSGALYLAAAFCTATAAPVPVRVTASGPVQGVAVGGILAFKAIPYAAAPLGPLRWQPPQPPVAWTAPRDASQFGPACPQPEASWMESMPQSEDCLTLNIWTPARGENLPVAVWIHGGSHVAGSGAEATF